MRTSETTTPRPANLPLMEEVLRLYPENVIVWVHMGLSRELTAMAAARSTWR